MKFSTTKKVAWARLEQALVKRVRKHYKEGFISSVERDRKINKIGALGDKVLDLIDEVFS